MRSANPVSAAALREETDGEALAEAMRRAIERGSLPSQPIPAGEQVAIEYSDVIGPPPRRRRAALALGVGLVCLAGAVALLLLGGGSVGGSGQSAFAAAAIEVAEANPRLLVTAPGWSVVDAGEFEKDQGEVTFAYGNRRFAIHWYPAHRYRSYLRDRATVSKQQRSTLLGRAATTVRYGVDRNGAEEYATMLAPEGSVFVEVRGAIGDRAAYGAVLRSLRPVSVETWLEAMPHSVVSPETRARVVARMLRSVPWPPGFDRAALEDESSVLNHYQLAVKVAGTVSCGWIESWLAATKAGDDERAREAVDAMATSPHWPMMPILIKGGGWSQNVKMAARSIATGHLNRDPAGSVVNPDGSGYEIGPAWALGLNCIDHYWRHPIKP
jgi:hypothetical protein